MGLDRVVAGLEDAYGFYEEALKEFGEGVREGSDYKIGDAAEKAWNVVVQASIALILKLLGKKPSSHWELEARFPEAGKLGKLMLRDGYGLGKDILTR